MNDLTKYCVRFHDGTELFIEASFMYETNNTVTLGRGGLNETSTAVFIGTLNHCIVYEANAKIQTK